jgi:ubiquinone/menaquinone biosynthesis C-methylase UbiE
MLTLDVGCGDKPKGNINIDQFMYKTPHRTKDANLKTMKIPNLINADAHYLPFRNGVFDVVFCNHLLEHKGIRYVTVAKELLRVSKRKVDINVPSQLCYSIRSPVHDKVFTKQTFETIFRNFAKEVKYARFIWRYVNVPTNYLHALIRRIPLIVPCPIPTEIRVSVWKVNPKVRG